MPDQSQTKGNPLVYYYYLRSSAPRDPIFLLHYPPHILSLGWNTEFTERVKSLLHNALGRILPKDYSGHGFPLPLVQARTSVAKNPISSLVFYEFWCSALMIAYFSKLNLRSVITQ